MVPEKKKSRHEVSLKKSDIKISHRHRNFPKVELPRHI